MPNVTIIYGERTEVIEAEEGALLGEVITSAGLPLEQPCAARGTCGKCKVLVEKGTAPPDEIELKNLSAGEIALNNRLACRARVQGDLAAPRIVLENGATFRGLVDMGEPSAKEVGPAGA